MALCGPLFWSITVHHSWFLGGLLDRILHGVATDTCLVFSGTAEEEHQACLTVPFSFLDLCKVQQWLKDLEEEFHPGEAVVMLVGNKTDLEEERR